MPDFPRGGVIRLTYPDRPIVRFYRVPHFVGMMWFVRPTHDEPWEPASQYQGQPWERLEAPPAGEEAHTVQAPPIDPPIEPATPDEVLQ